MGTSMKQQSAPAKSHDWACFALLKQKGDKIFIAMNADEISKD